MGDVLAYSGAMRRLAVEVGKIASDLRLLSMGPRAGLAEIALPAVQPGSSIMPGKVNPSVPEMVNQVCFQVMGCDATVAHRLRGRPARAERDDAGHRVERAARVDDPARGDDGRSGLRCVDGIAADEARARELLDRSTADGDRAQPVHRLRGDGGDRQGVGEDAASRSARSSSSAACSTRRGSTRSCRSSDDARRHRGREGQEGGGQVGQVGRTGRRAAWKTRCRAGRVLCLASCAVLPVLPACPHPTSLPRQQAERPSLRRRRISACSKRPIASSGRSRIRSWTRSASPTARSSPISAPAAAGSRCGSPARRPERPRLRRGHPAADDRGDQPARAAREPART